MLSVLILVFAVVQQYATRDRTLRTDGPCSATRRRRCVREIVIDPRGVVLLMPFYFLVIMR